MNLDALHTETPPLHQALPAMTHLLDDLDASLRDFEHPPSPPPHHIHRSTALHSEATMTEDDLEDSEAASVGGYSPPAWRRLGNGDRSSGFWRGPHDLLGRGYDASSPVLEHDVGYDSPHEVVLEQAIRTRLPRGSASPDKGRSVSPERVDDKTLHFKPEERQSPPRESPSDNCKSPSQPYRACP